jgi:hypothetical protein
MRTGAVLLALAAAAPAHAQSREVEVGVEEFAYRTAETPLNRANVLGLAATEHLLRGVLNWRETHGAFRAVFRGYLEHRPAAAAEATDWNARQAYAQYAFGELLTVRAGKQRVAWGSGFAWNPTNRIEPPKNPLNTSLEQEGARGLRLDVAPAPWVGIVVVAAWNDTTLRDLPFETARPPRRTGASRARFLVGETDLAVVVSGGKGQRTLWGLDLARGVGAGITAHLEASAYRGAELFPPREGELFTRVAAGLLRTLGSSQTVALEYFWNEEGLDDAGMAAYRATLDALWESGRTEEYAVAAARPYAGGMGLRRHYLHASWGHGQAGGRWSFAARLVAGLDDGGFALTPGVTFAPRGDLTLQLDLVLPGGPADSEYRLAPVRGGLQARARYLF